MTGISEKDYIDKRNGGIFRTCPLCNNPLCSQDYYRKNEFNFSMEELDTIWNNKSIVILCCICFMLIKELPKSLENMDLIHYCYNWFENKHNDFYRDKKELRLFIDNLMKDFYPNLLKYLEMIR